MCTNSKVFKSCFSVCLTLFMLLFGTSQTSLAFEPPAYGPSLCLGVGTNPFFADVSDANPGSELVLTNITEQILADTNQNDMSVVRAAVSVQILDRTGSQVWRSEPLVLFSPDQATVIPATPPFIPEATYFFPGIISNTFNTFLFAGGQTCYGTAYAVQAGGQKYLAVAVGFMVQTGDDEATGVDETRVNVWILNRNTGAVVYEHRLRPRAGRFLSTIGLSSIAPVDADADDELVAAWVVPLGNSNYKLRYETYNILTGALEESFDAFTKDSRIFE